ncbi:lytic transglycosylase [Streptomyces sp. TS71-3]|uniref:lytic transglycosylase domain-containing protein n=1 Tax=Streptomyces sp. TS71-3 TaxID=2733862 RepID=UPI001B0BE404|nr:lytic transglycosylase [Streptomyces sp. TS71-3]GHJ38297.1 lytic transglycosylase [Streptomyces sp. TS71-3]
MAAHFGRRLRRGAATTAVAAAAVAALSASQASTVTGDDGHHGQASETTTPPPDSSSATGDSPYYTDLPPLNSPAPPPAADQPPAVGGPEAGIPASVLDAYKKAADALAASQPGCNLRWELLAAIGKVESGQARGGAVDANGTTLSPILGPVLDGNGFAAINDTDGGALDGDSVHDRAVGPMQFIPSTWNFGGPDHTGWGADGNGDGKKDPNNVYDAALAAGHYLCAGGRDLAGTGDLNAAILAYNHSQNYLDTVLSWYEYYRKGTHEVPNGTGVQPGGRSDQTPGAPTPGGSATPDKPGKPSAPGTPSTPGKPSGPNTPGDGSTDQPSPPASGPGGDTGSQTPTDTVTKIENAGTGTLSALTGDTFAQRIKARTEDAQNKPVSRVRVSFTLVGDTDATFDGGETVATVQTDTDGVATAPALKAGQKTGGFTVRATVVGRPVTALDFNATVAERQADKLARTTDTDLICTPGGTFENQVEVKATDQGAVASGVAATATLIASPLIPMENDKGPYFKDDAGKTVRTLKTLKTDKNGILKLPTLYADDTTGTFTLRITTAGGASLDVKLTVQKADDQPTGEPSQQPSGGLGA